MGSKGIREQISVFILINTIRNLALFLTSALFLFQFGIFWSVGAHAQTTTPPVTLNFIFQMQNLAPRDAQIEEAVKGTALAEFIDKKVLEILKTPTGHVLCGALTASPEQLRKIFFINEEFVLQGFSECLGSFGETMPQGFFQKRYFLFWTKQKDYLVDGWTSFANETAFFLTREPGWENRLTQSIIHELVISLDKKEQLGFWGAGHSLDISST
jgi:hypothetical protein